MTPVVIAVNSHAATIRGNPSRLTSSKILSSARYDQSFIDGKAGFPIPRTPTGDP
jgi:hypothetical protein